MGAACCPCDGRAVVTRAVRARCPPQRSCHGHGARASLRSCEDDQMPPLITPTPDDIAAVVAEDHLASLQEAYAEWSAPAGRGRQRQGLSLVQQPAQPEASKASWFKFRGFWTQVVSWLCAETGKAEISAGLDAKEDGHCTPHAWQNVVRVRALVWGCSTARESAFTNVQGLVGLVVLVGL
eukprot:154415-Amphidinium_carterae.1